MGEYGAVGHDVCEIMGGSVTKYVDFIDEVINTFVVSAQCKLMPIMKPAEMHWVPTW